MPAKSLLQRLALFSEFAQSARLGRTAIMKLCFFLQESKGIPLGYHFSIYSYGPFDSDVLSDLSAAENMNILKSNVVYYSSGSGYEYTLGSDTSVREIEAEFLSLHREDIRWVLTNFGKRTAGDLELLSTTLFVAKFSNPTSVNALVNEVAIIKPHFNKDRIQKGFEELVTLGVLRQSPS